MIDAIRTAPIATRGEESAASAQNDRVILAHGGGGELTGRLLTRHVLPPLLNRALAPLGDGAVLPAGAAPLVFTTDSYVVTPIEFPGGDIGRLAVCGTVNDLAVMGAEPAALSLGLILEEGLALGLLDRIMASIAAAAREAGVQVVTGDTKVIERRALADADARPECGLFINTAGLGYLRADAHLDVRRLQPDDAVLVSGTIGDHGLAVMSARRDIGFETNLRSDVAPLNGLVRTLLECGADVKFMRDATRGGIAGVLADLCDGSGLSVEIDEDRIPVHPGALHAAEMIGLDPLSIANEGKVVCVVAAGDAEKARAALRSHALGQAAQIIGRMTSARPPLVEMKTRVGGRRIVQRPYGEDLPRIC